MPPDPAPVPSAVIDALRRLEAAVEALHALVRDPVA